MQRHARDPYDVILSQSAGALGYLSDARRRLGLPTVVVLHGSLQSEAVTAWRGARNVRGVYRLARAGWSLPQQAVRWRAAAPAVAHWAAVSEHVALDARRELGIPANRITVIPNGVDTNQFHPNPHARARIREEFGIPADAPVVAVATRLERAKGVDIALDAVAAVSVEYPQLRLVVAGDGHDARALRRRATALGLGANVVFLGLVTPTRLSEALAAADVFALPTRCVEALPSSALEAASAGLPVVGSAVPGVTAAVSDGRTGLLVPPGDVDALASALRSLLGDPTRRAAFGAAGRDMAVDRFSRTTVTRALEAMLDGVVAMHEARAGTTP